MLPKSTGRIEKVLVDVGSKVQAGDTLALLEQDSAQIPASRRVPLAGAEAKLATLQAGARADDVAAAEAALICAAGAFAEHAVGGRAEDIQLAKPR